MPFDRFYVNCPLQDDVSIQEEEFHHLIHVMRIEENDTVELVNGQGMIAEAKVISIKKKEAILRIEKSQFFKESAQRLTLAIPILRLAKLEWIVEKCTELGVYKFIFFPADFSEKEELSEHQKKRLEHISISALKQCGRLYLPKMEYLKSLNNLFLVDQPIFFGDFVEEKIELPKQDAITFVSGPERGFSQKELKLLKEKGKAIRLNSNILRAETAPMVACSLYYF